MAARRWRGSAVAPLGGSAVRLVLCCLLPSMLVAQAPERIGLIDFYGYGHLTRTQLDAALGLKPGDPFPTDQVVVEGRLRRLPRVTAASVQKVCCDGQGKPMLFAGLQRGDAPAVSFRARPTGSIRISDSLRAAYDTFTAKLMEGIRAGQAGDDVSEGHSLLAYGPAREAQLVMRQYVMAHEAEVRRVLRESSADDDRTIAAEALGYGADKRSVIPDLVAAAFDAYGETRNNAVRALYAIGMLAQRRPELGIQVPVEQVIPLLYSSEWTDRNKTSLALFSLSESRDPALLAVLRAKALEPLLEIARWQSDGHAMPGYFIVARIAGVSDGEAFEAFQAGEREKILARVSQD